MVDNDEAGGEEFWKLGEGVHGDYLRVHRQFGV